jgi:DNA polymerase-4
MIVHLDIDAFFASVEQALIPRLRGRPVAVGSGCIASCSYEARRFGLRAGTGLGEARRRCPDLVIMPGSHGIYRCFADRIWELCREVAPAQETFLDDAYLDISGTERLYGSDPRRVIAHLRRRIHQETGLQVTGGIGPSRMIARLASKSVKPDGLRWVRPEEVEAFLVDRPAEDLPGVGHKTARQLARFNVHTVRDLRRLPRELLEQLFGRNGGLIFERAHGRDTRVVAPNEVPRSISRETTFHRETTDPREIMGMLHYLAERAMKSVRELGLQTQTIGLRVRYADFKQENIQRRLPRPVHLTTPVFETAVRLLKDIHTRRVALRLIGITLTGIRARHGRQLELFADPAEDDDDRLAEALDEVRRRFGFAAVTKGKSLNLLGKLRQDDNGFVLRTPCLTK